MLGVLFHFLYPEGFLYQTYLYHMIRKDNRHNFSSFFYFIYLTFTSITPTQSLLAFLPQFVTIIAAGIKYARDLPFCLLIQTWCFVAFNKVCTAQYFVWWIALLPIALPLQTKKLVGITKKRFLILMGAWMASDLIWNYFAELLEGYG